MEIQEIIDGILNAHKNIQESIKDMDTTCPHCETKNTDRSKCTRTVVYNPETKAMHDNYAWHCDCGQTFQTLSGPLPHLQAMADEYEAKKE